MRRFLILLLILLLAGLAAGTYWWKHGRARPEGVAYIAEDDVTVWSSTAQVRQPVVTLHYGQQVEVLETLGDRVRIRAPQGLVGWLDQTRLIMPEVWQRIQGLAARARPMPVEARGHTRVPANLHVEPGRGAPAIARLGSQTPVEILARAVASWEQGQGQPSRTEDWLLVRAKTPRAGELAGWVLRRFVDLDLPSWLADYAAAAAMRVVAWQELAHVTDPRAGTIPYLLVAGARGPEGQTCDFTMLRVYTWGFARQRYETAYVENDLCGMLPIETAPQPNGDYLFHFTVLARTGRQVESYRMRGTIVRRAQARAARAKPRRRRARASAAPSRSRAERLKPA